MSIDYNTNIHTIDLKKIEKTWYAQFWKAITAHCKPSDLENRFKSFAFIIFNYDRCIEHFLYHALKQFYHISDEEVAKIVNSIEIYNPYGTVGALPWQSNINNMKFGGEPNANDLLELVKRIKTFTQGTDTNSNVDDIRELMRTSPRLIFLGFAFHKLNMDLLKPPKSSMKPLIQNIFAVALKMYEHDKLEIRNRLSEDYLVGDFHFRNDLNSYEMLCHYSYGLNFG